MLFYHSMLVVFTSVPVVKAASSKPAEKVRSKSETNNKTSIPGKTSKPGRPEKSAEPESGVETSKSNSNIYSIHGGYDQDEEDSEVELKPYSRSRTHDAPTPAVDFNTRILSDDKVYSKNKKKPSDKPNYIERYKIHRSYSEPEYGVDGIIEKVKGSGAETSAPTAASSSHITDAGYLSGGYLSSLCHDVIGLSVEKQEVKKQPIPVVKAQISKPAKQVRPKPETSVKTTKPAIRVKISKPESPVKTSKLETRDKTLKLESRIDTPKLNIKIDSIHGGYTTSVKDSEVGPNFYSGSVSQTDVNSLRQFSPSVEAYSLQHRNIRYIYGGPNQNVEDTEPGPQPYNGSRPLETTAPAASKKEDKEKSNAVAKATVSKPVKPIRPIPEREKSGAKKNKKNQTDESSYLPLTTYFSGGYLSSLYSGAFGPAAKKREIKKQSVPVIKAASLEPAEQVRPKSETIKKTSKPAIPEKNAKPESGVETSKSHSKIYSIHGGFDHDEEESEFGLKPYSGSRPLDAPTPAVDLNTPILSDDKAYSKNKKKPSDKLDYIERYNIHRSYSEPYLKGSGAETSASTPASGSHTTDAGYLIGGYLGSLYHKAIGPSAKKREVKKQAATAAGAATAGPAAGKKGAKKKKSVPAQTPEEESRLRKAIKKWVPLIAFPISVLALLGIIYYIFKILHGYLVTTNFHIYEAFVDFLSLLQSVEMRSLLGMSDNKSSETETEEPKENKPAEVEVAENASEESLQNPQNWKYFGRYRSPGILRILDRNDLEPCADDNSKNRNSGISGNMKMFGNKASSKTSYNSATSSKTSKCASGEECDGKKSSNNKSD